MESRVSNNCTRNIYKHSTPEKEVNRKENTVGKKATGLSEVLFHYVMFCDKENKDLSSNIYSVSFGGIS